MKKNEDKEISKIIEDTLLNIKNIADGNVVIGKTIEIKETTLIPLNKINVGYVIGESSINIKKKSLPSLINGNTTGFNIYPLGFIVVKNGLVQYVGIDKAYPYKKLFDIIEQSIKMLSKKREKKDE